MARKGWPIADVFNKAKTLTVITNKIISEALFCLVFQGRCASFLLFRLIKCSVECCFQLSDFLSYFLSGNVTFCFLYISCFYPFTWSNNVILPVNAAAPLILGWGYLAHCPGGLLWAIWGYIKQVRRWDFWPQWCSLN